MVRLRASISIFLLSVLATTSAWGRGPETFSLFNPNQTPVSNYDQIVEELDVGDTIIFSNDKSFKIEGKLGSGNLTRVFDVGGGVAIRIPKMGFFNEMLHLYMEGYSVLTREKVPTIKIYEKQSLDREYILAEKLPHPIVSLESLINGKVKVTPAQRSLMYDQLVAFARKTAMFNIVGDFKLDALIWRVDHWELMDWDHQHERGKAPKEKTIWDWNEIKLPQSLRGRIRKAIQEERMTGCLLMGVDGYTRASPRRTAVNR
jgi:hypothetical protein